MESFEHVVKVYLESKGYVVTANVKFPVKVRTTKKARIEHQTHGYEVDIVAARRDRLLLASVKSFFGSAGVSKNGFTALSTNSDKRHISLYAIFNKTKLRNQIIKRACERYGYPASAVRLHLFVGRFVKGDEAAIRKLLKRMRVGGESVGVTGLEEIVSALVQTADAKTYSNDPVICTLKCLKAAGRLKAS